MNIDYQMIISLISKGLWPLFRITGLFLSMPLISSTYVPRRIKIVLICAFSLVCAPLMTDKLSFLDFEGRYILILIHEVMLGFIMGFVLQIVFQVFVMGGQIIAMQAGLGFATMVEPATKASVPLISQFYLLVISLIFLSLNGHLALFDALMESFVEMPVGKLSLGLSSLDAVLHFSGWMFKEAVLVSLPAILALLIVNLAFGIMTRIAPQLNIFSLGFPITLLMGIVILGFSLTGVADEMRDAMEDGLKLIKGVILHG